MKNQNTKFKKGFTLIELIVVMAVFLFIITAALGVFLSVVKSQSKVSSEQQLLSQISYVQEYMSKALRAATTDASGSCLGANNAGYIYSLLNYNIPIASLSAFEAIKFFNQTDNACEEFFIDNAISGQTNTPLVLKELKSSSNLMNAINITSPALQINSVKFSINGSSGGIFSEQSRTAACTSTQCGASSTDTVQPRITMVLNVSVAGESNGISCSVSSPCAPGNSCVSGTCAPNRIFQVMVSQRNLNVNNGQR